jgi:hypothetical protein
MRKVNKMLMYPKACAVTGRAEGPAIDTGITVPPGRAFRIYLRENVVKEMAAQVKMVPEDEFIAAMDRGAELEAELAEMRDKLTEAQDIINAWSTLEEAGKAAAAEKVAAKKPKPKAKATA